MGAPIGREGDRIKDLELKLVEVGQWEGAGGGRVFETKISDGSSLRFW